MPNRRLAGLAGALRDAVIALIAFYGTCAALFVLLHITAGERLNLVGFVDNFMPLLLLPALPLMLLSLILRRRWLALILLPAMLMLGVSYGTFYMPDWTRASASPATTSLTLMTYNLHAEARTLAPQIDLINRADADVVALQELSPEAAQAFATAFAPRYPYQALHPNNAYPVSGQGVLSRYPIQADDYWVQGLGHQRVMLAVDGRPLTLYNVHSVHPFEFTEQGPTFEPDQRSRVIADILRRTGNERSPVILAGDFNMTDQTDVYQQIAARYHDTYHEVGWGMGFTFPSSGLILPPLARIDYVFHDDSIRSIAARVWPTSGGSDHRPVWVQLAIQG